MPKVGNIDMSEEDIKEFRDVFDMVDKDKSNALTSEEVKDLMELLGMHVTLGEVKQMVTEIDEDGSGQVDFDEFLQVMARPQEVPYTRQDLVRAFRMFADTGAPSGCISPENLEKVLYCGDKVSPDEVMRLVHRLETTQDGWIHFNDQINLIMNK